MQHGWSGGVNPFVSSSVELQILSQSISLMSLKWPELNALKEAKQAWEALVTKKAICKCQVLGPADHGTGSVLLQQLGPEF